MAVRTYTMTPARRAWILRNGGDGVPSGLRLDGGDEVACYRCGKAIHVAGQVVSVQNSSRTRQYHYRCWRWGAEKVRPQVSRTKKTLEKKT